MLEFAGQMSTLFDYECLISLWLILVTSVKFLMLFDTTDQNIRTDFSFLNPFNRFFDVS